MDCPAGPIESRGYLGLETNPGSRTHIRVSGYTPCMRREGPGRRTPPRQLRTSDAPSDPLRDTTPSRRAAMPVHTTPLSPPGPTPRHALRYGDATRHAISRALAPTGICERICHTSTSSGRVVSCRRPLGALDESILPRATRFTKGWSKWPYPIDSPVRTRVEFHHAIPCTSPPPPPPPPQHPSRLPQQPCPQTCPRHPGDT